MLAKLLSRGDGMKEVRPIGTNATKWQMAWEVQRWNKGK